MLESIKANYGDEVRLVFRHLPLITIHDKAQISAEAAEAAGAQGMFWEMHDILFANQASWNNTPEAEVIDTFVGYAEEIGLKNVAQFRRDLENDTYAAKVLADYEAAVGANLNSTPTLLVNQVDYPAQAFGMAYEGVDVFIQLMKLRKTWFSQPEQVIDLTKAYEATIETEKGDIVMELYPDTAPANVNSFVFLAQQGWFKDVTFHRVLDGFMAQGGDPTGTGVGFPGYRCDDEVVPSRTFDGAGVVALANSGPNSNGSQFFITYTATPQLNANFTIIGHVIEGQSVVDSLTRRDPSTSPDAPAGDKIIDVRVREQ